ncbi:hypothetical protein LRP49_00165 [Enterovibrio sp. ZSDZ35]|uniref:DUF1127 domain-containing protein n=1 Tax=Enterovibrio qingdaonensis TaxID=2899818 RepID=A0ABT5QF42_9GAMM|nr:hypothetical protein [Enterovibrio sp. ZSDZ35]MDD1779593.1 hypothetical protein [Enterovibrio sp. ZSDZ35]
MMGESLRQIAKTETDKLLSKVVAVHIELVSKATHRLWSAWRNYQLMKELELRVNDDVFLRDIGVTRDQVNAELAMLKRGKRRNK